MTCYITFPYSTYMWKSKNVQFVSKLENIKIMVIYIVVILSFTHEYVLLTKLL